MNSTGFSAVSCIIMLTSAFLGAEFSTAEELVGVSDPQRAEYHWVIHCQGCHGVDATGSQGGAPNMVGIVSQFLHSTEGRAFLGRVPGVAFVELPDKDVAELLNWLLQTFDQRHIPKPFKPYSDKEINQLRKTPLVSQAFVVRKQVLQSLNHPEGVKK